MRADRPCLMIGFRSPLCDGRAVIACFENTAAMFEAGEEPAIGHRSLPSTWVETAFAAWRTFLGSVVTLVVGGPVARQQTQFGLWFWLQQLQIAS